MKTIFRNFITTLRRFRLASVLNILGLSVAFAAFTVILMQVHYDRSFDRCHSKADRTYRIEVSEDGTTYNAMVGRKWAELIRERFPQVETIGLRMSYSPAGNYLKVEHNGQQQGYQVSANLIHPDFTQVFDFEMTEGSLSAISEPGQILIPESMARRMWAGQSAYGQRVTFTGTTDTVMTVGGVYRDFPRNTLVSNIIYYGITPTMWGPWDGWQFNYELYVTIPASVNRADVERELLAAVHNSPDVPDWIKNYKAVRLYPLPELHYSSEVRYDSVPKGSRATTTVLLAIALLVIGIAAVNFVNFSTSLVPMRIKSINTQKVLGSPVSTLRAALVGEAIGISLIAFLLSLIFVYLVGQTGFTAFLDADISLSADLSMILLSFGVALAVGLFAGLYPAYYATKFPPALVLKGSFGMSTKGRALRTSLVGSQYVISTGLIIAALFMQLQNGYIRTRDTGYNTEQVAVLQLNDALTKDNRRLLVNKLKESPQIANVAFSQFLFGNGGAQSNSWDFGDEKIRFDYLPVSPEFLDVMDIRLTDGRNFQESDETGAGRKYIVNQATIDRHPILQMGQEIPFGQLVGLIGNINYKPLQTTSNDPFCLAIEPLQDLGASMPWTYVRIQGDIVAAVDHIRKTIASIDPAYPVSVQFYDEVFNNIYQSERKTTSLITIFSLLAVVISLVGVFGLVVFETQYRRKEIGVRKVLGATVAEILAMFNKSFIRLVLVCFVVAAPLAWYGVTRWLESFAYRTPVYWWVFALSLVIVLLITLITVTIQSWRAATANPVSSLKTE